MSARGIGARRSRRGFTLLEVMVAVAILGVGITAILAAQWGAVRTVSEARNLSEANGLARCKMAELEAQLQTEGFTENDFAESGPCCDGEDNPRITCTWQITRPTFPDAKFGELDLDADLDLAGTGKTGESGGSKSGSGLSAVGALAQANKGGLELPAGGNASDVAQSLTGDMGNVTDGIESMALGIVYPDLRAVFETGTRKVSVRAAWASGEGQYFVDVVQWVTNARVAGLAVTAPIEAEEDDGSGSGSTGSSGSTKGGSSTKKSGSDMFAPPSGRK